MKPITDDRIRELAAYDPDAGYWTFAGLELIELARMVINLQGRLRQANETVVRQGSRIGELMNQAESLSQPAQAQEQPPGRAPSGLIGRTVNGGEIVAVCGAMYEIKILTMSANGQLTEFVADGLYVDLPAEPSKPA